MDRKIYSEVRELFIDELKKDLIGPNYNEIDILDESPSQAYLTGILNPLETEEPLTLEVLEDIYKESFEQFNDNEVEIQEKENEEVEELAIKENLIINKRQNSIGIKSYLFKETQKILFRATWGEYEKFKATENVKNKKTGEFEEKMDLRQVFGHILPKFFLGATSRMDCSTSQVARQSEKSL